MARVFLSNRVAKQCCKTKAMVLFYICVETALNVFATFFFSTLFQYDEKDAYENFKQFYEDTLPEFRKAGTVVQFKVFFVNSLKNNNDAYKNARINAKFNCSSL